MPAPRNHHNTKKSPLREKLVYDALANGGKTRLELEEATGISRGQLSVYLFRLIAKNCVRVADEVYRPPGRGPNIPIYEQGAVHLVKAKPLTPVKRIRKPVEVPVYQPRVIPKQEWYSSLGL
jgi:hypothetical protein